MFRPPIIRPFRGFQPPLWPFRVNRDSPQANGLHKWFTLQAMPEAQKIIDLTSRDSLGFQDLTVASGSIAIGTKLAGNYVDLTNGKLTAGKSYNNESEYSWCLWMESTAAPDLSNLQYVFVEGDAAESILFTWNNNFGGTQSAFHKDAGGTFRGAQIVSSLSANTLYFIAASWNDATDTLKVYLDGLFEAQNTGVNGITGPGGTEQLVFPKLGSPGFPFKIYEYRFYTRELSAAEFWQMHDPRTRYELYAPIHGATVVIGGPVGVTVSDIEPASGPTAGGQSVTILGDGFAGDATVQFGVTDAVNVDVISSTEIDCDTPPHAAGVVDVTVTNPSVPLTGGLGAGYEFVAAPDVTSVSPNSGATTGGTSVSIHGTGFRSGATVKFGASDATSVVVVSSTLITCNTPAHSAGLVSVTVTNDDDQTDTLAGAFTYFTDEFPGETGSFGLLVDWNDDGDYTDAGEDISDRGLNRSGLTCSRGRDQVRQFAPPRAGQLNVEVDNRSRDYSVENTDSPLFGDLLPGRRIRLLLREEPVLNSDGRKIWTGLLDDILERPAPTQKSVELPSLGMLSRLVGKTVNSPVYQNISIDEAINVVFDLAGWPAGERVIQASIGTLDWYWLADQDAFQAILELLLTEGPPSAIYERGDGFAVFENREARTTQTRSTTSQATYATSDIVDLIPSWNFKDLIKVCTVTVQEREPAALDEIWNYGRDLVLGADEEIQITIRPSGSDPFVDAVLPQGFGTNEQQTLRAREALTEGTFKIGFRGELTADLDFDATAADIQAALEALTAIGSGNVVCSGGSIDDPDTPVVVQFWGTLKEQDVELLTIESALNPFTGPATVNIITLEPFDPNPRFLLHPSSPFTSGAFKLRAAPQSSLTADIAYNATAATIQLRLEALPLISPGDVSVSGGPIDSADVTVEFSGGFYWPNWTLQLFPPDGFNGVTLATEGEPTTTIDVTETVKGTIPDYLLLDGDIADMSFDRDSGPYCTLTIVAGASGLTLRNLRVRAKLLVVVRTHQPTYPVGVSVPEGQIRKPSIRAEIPLEDGLAMAQSYVEFYQNRRPTAVLRVIRPVADGVALDAELQREISDRITIVESQTGIDADYFIEQIRISIKDRICVFEFGCERAD